MKIFLNDMVFNGCHGLYPAEKVTPQPYRIDIRIELCSDAPGRSDNVQDTLNWSDLRQEIRLLVEQKSFSLVERLATEIVDTVLAHPQACAVEVTVKKPEAWKDSGYPSVAIRKTRETK